MSKSGSKIDIMVQEFIDLRKTKEYSEVFKKLSGKSIKDNEAKACLIQLVLQLFGEETDNYLVKRDTVLNSWSLLSEYSDISETMERRKQYVLDTAFKGRHTHDTSFRKLNPNTEEYSNEIDTRMNSLLKYENSLYEKLVKYFSSNYTTEEDIERFIDSAKDNWISKDTGEVLLPSRFYNEPTLDDNGDDDTTGTDEAGDKTHLIDRIKQSIRKPKRKTVIISAIVVVILITSAILLSLLTDKSASYEHLTPEEFDRAVWASVETQATPFPNTLKFISAESEDDYKTHNSWGDSDGGRQIYTSDDVNKGNLENRIVFNSVYDGAAGDERKFVGVRAFSNPENTWTNDVINVHDGETYTICLYVHNDNPNGLDAISENTTASFLIPEDVNTSLTITGYLDSSNATPNRYWDTVTLKSNDYFKIEYVEGSAKYTNEKMESIALNDKEIFKGHPLGYDRFDGIIPGGTKYASVVTIDVIVHYSKPYTLTISARLEGTKGRNDLQMEANIGDVIEYIIEYQNLSNTTAQNVTIKDRLPDNVEYLKGSTIIYNHDHQNGISEKSDSIIEKDGINIGNYDTQGNATVVFKARVVDNTLDDGLNTLKNIISFYDPNDKSEQIIMDDEVVVRVIK